MTVAQQQQLVTLLEQWVERHPRQDEPTIVFVGRDYTPRELLDEVCHETEFGRSFGDFLFSNAERLDTTVEAMIERAIVANERSR